ncbi:hypothetical protein UQW22_05705 [Isoptericola halotolerans]|uniref:hypothetical protein n=1 Tax=Isoptericola halotolerans TaxID=300560 RepID=UPI00388D016C
MYGGLWRILPGPAWFRVLFLLVMFVALVWVCFEWVFPWLSTYVPINDNTVEAHP